MIPTGPTRSFQIVALPPWLPPRFPGSRLPALRLPGPRRAASTAVAAFDGLPRASGTSTGQSVADATSTSCCGCEKSVGLPFQCVPVASGGLAADIRLFRLKAPDLGLNPSDNTRSRTSLRSSGGPACSCVSLPFRGIVILPPVSRPTFALAKSPGGPTGVTTFEPDPRGHRGAVP